VPDHARERTNRPPRVGFRVMNDQPELPRKEGPSWRIWALAIAGILLLILILQNLQKVRVDFLFIHTDTPLIFAILISGALGALIGWATPRVRRGGRD
jgi:uncharacterized integral membrane protein